MTEYDEMPPNLSVPHTVEDVIQSFAQSEEPFSIHEVQEKLSKARHELQDPTEGGALGAWAEVLAFALVGSRTGDSPWNTFYAPMASGTADDGRTVHMPDISNADGRVIQHWRARAESLTHPILKARYADLVWDLDPVISGNRRDPAMARIAVDAYITSVSSNVLPKPYYRFEAALRALDLACLLGDKKRTATARECLMELYNEAIEVKEGFWWLAYDRLVQDKRAGLTDEERQTLVNGLDELVLHFGNASDPEAFDPHSLQNAAD